MIVALTFKLYSFRALLPRLRRLDPRRGLRTELVERARPSIGHERERLPPRPWEASEVLANGVLLALAAVGFRASGRSVGRLQSSPSAGAMGDTFPRLSARTQRFTLGEPRNIVVSPDGQRVVFVRSRAGDDPVNCLWVLDAATGEERLVADPVAAARRRRRGRPARRRAGPPRAGPRGRRRHRRLRHRRRRAWRPPSRWAAGCSWPAWCRPRPASSPSKAPCSTPGPTRRPGGSPT